MYAPYLQEIIIYLRIYVYSTINVHSVHLHQIFISGYFEVKCSFQQFLSGQCL